jgi:hypothetical protein
MTLNLRTIPWHPVLLVASIVVAFWMDAVVSPQAGVRSLGIAVLGAALLTLMAGAVLRNWHAGGVAVAALIALLYTKHLVRLVADLGPSMPLPVLGVWLVAMALVAVLLVRVLVRAARRLTWPDATWLLNRVALVLLLATVLAGLLGGSFARGAAQLGSGGPLPSADPTAPEATAPDIYVVLLDGYPRADVLEWAFGIDNSPFLGELEERGFSVADQAHSNYLWTHVTLASMLNMAYIEQIEPLRDVIDGRAPLYPRLTETINDNAVFDVAREQGYRTVTIGGGFEQVTPRRADTFLDAPQMTEFEVKLLNSTWLGEVVSVVAPTWPAGEHGDRIRATLALLGDVARAPRPAPRLVFAHVPTPHQPSVFDADGQPLSVPLNDAFYADSAEQKEQSLAEFTAEYREHLAYTNRLVLDALDDLLAASSQPPIVVLFADHGSASRVDWRAVQPLDADPAVLLERTGTLFAALTPDRGDVFPEDVSPVDIFRFLFDAYFDTGLGAATPPPGGGQIAPVDPSVLR